MVVRRMIPLSVIALLIVACGAAPAMAANVYKWIDKRGKVHYTDQSPPADATTQETRTIADTPTVAPAPAPTSESAVTSDESTPAGFGTPQPPRYPNGKGRCTHKITSSIDGRIVKPGDVICVLAGTRTNLTINNITGTRANPVIIRNEGGQVTLKGNGGFTLHMSNAKFFRLTGKGADGVQYGFNITGGSQGVRIDKGSEQFEVDHIEVSGAKIGMATKTKCGDGFTKANFTQHNTVIHHNYIHHNGAGGGEGFYIGSNDTLSPARENPACGPNSVLNNLWVYQNRVSYIGKDAINIKGTPIGCYVYNNQTDHDGLGGDPQQSGGIALTDNTKCHAFNNKVSDSPFAIIKDNGTGGNQIHHNTIINATTGIKSGDSTPNATTVDLFCNTFTSVKTQYIGKRGKVLACS